MWHEITIFPDNYPLLALMLMFSYIYTMKMIGKRPLITLLLAAMVLSSCGLFRKKNKCHTCPTWSMEMKAEQQDEVRS